MTCNLFTIDWEIFHENFQIYGITTLHVYTASINDRLISGFPSSLCCNNNIMWQQLGGEGGGWGGEARVATFSGQQRLHSVSITCD